MTQPQRAYQIDKVLAGTTKEFLECGNCSFKIKTEFYDWWRVGDRNFHKDCLGQYIWRSDTFVERLVETNPPLESFWRQIKKK